MVDGPALKLTENEYTDIVATTRRIYLARDVEEKLDLLLENYLEYEMELLNLGLRYSLFRRLDASRMDMETQLLNRRILNLLTVARTYIDQVTHAVSQYFPDRSRDAEVKGFFSAEYDQHLEYRIAEELRNHAQHRRLPVHEMSWPSKWENMDSPERWLRFWVAPSFLVDELIYEGKFKPSVLKELQASGKSSWSLTPILRRYVESLTTVHKAVRRLLEQQADRDHQALLRVRERARAELGPKLTGFFVALCGEDGSIREHHYVSEKSWERRASLMRKNDGFQNLSRRYASGEHP